MESLRLTTTLFATPKAIYDAWISGERHGAMTGGAATSDPQKGGTFTAWDEYISGKYLELEPGKRLLQAWRTTEFPATAPDSRLEVKFVKTPEGTRLTILQSGIPDGQGEMYADAWQQDYFAPMSVYFVAKASADSSKEKTAARVATKKKAPARAGKKKTPAPAKKKSVAKAATPKAKASKKAPRVTAAKKKKTKKAATSKARRK